MFPAVFDCEDNLNGSDNKTVINAMANIVPIEKRIRKRMPEKKLGVVGRIANITAALPARP